MKATIYQLLRTDAGNIPRSGLKPSSELCIAALEATEVRGGCKLFEQRPTKTFNQIGTVEQWRFHLIITKKL